MFPRTTNAIEDFILKHLRVTTLSNIFQIEVLPFSRLGKISLISGKQRQ